MRLFADRIFFSRVSNFLSGGFCRPTWGLKPLTGAKRYHSLFLLRRGQMLRNQQLLLICTLLCLLRAPIWGYFFFFSQTFLFPSSYNVPCLRGSHLSLVRYAWLQGKCVNTLGRTEACTNSPRWYLSTSPWTPKTLVKSQLVLVRKVVHNLHSWWAKVPRSVKKRTKMSFSSKFVKKKLFKQHFTKKIPHNSKFENILWHSPLSLKLAQNKHFFLREPIVCSQRLWQNSCFPQVLTLCLPCQTPKIFSPPWKEC